MKGLGTGGWGLERVSKRFSLPPQSPAPSPQSLVPNLPIRQSEEYDAFNPLS